MKRLFFLASALFVVCMGLWAEEEAPKNSTESLALPVLPPLVFDTVNTGTIYLKQKNFLLLDGTYLNYQEMRERLLAVPGNEKHVRRAKGFEVAGVINLCLGLAGLLANMTFSFIPDLPNQKIFEVGALAVGAFGTVMAVNFFSNGSGELHTAIQNYNLSVMGIPIPKRL